ncbi:MAG: bacillithiol system redox-active protein YtxJ [Bacteroidia bacterium]|nr:bacillithiol system redox-active protein YtxJ [Bacteroidia bacterium]
MLWHKLTDINQIQEVKVQSTKKLAVLIFKHSTRCSISSMALNRVESKWEDNENIATFYLDLLNHRDISNKIAEDFQVEHASPQVLLIKNGACIYHASHSNINAQSILDAL